MKEIRIKKLFALILSIMLALTLVACTSTVTEKVDDTAEASPTLVVDQGDTDNKVAELVTTKLTVKETTAMDILLRLYHYEQVTTKVIGKDATLDVLSSLVDIDDATTTIATSSSSSSSSSSWNGGLNTDPTVYGLDPNNVWVQEAMKLLGKEGLCMYIAADLYNAAYEILYDSWPSSSYASGLTWDAVSSQLEIGDIVYYNYMKSGSNTIKSHVAIYLGNGLALHGNWTGGVARISYVYQEAKSYNLSSTTHTVTKSGINWSALSPEETLEKLGIDYSDMSEETCRIVNELLENEDYDALFEIENEFIYCIEMGYLD